MSTIVQGFAELIILGMLGSGVLAVVSLVRMRQAPPTPPFARRRSPSSVVGQLRFDPNAVWLSDHRGFLFQRRVFFVATGCPPTRISGPQLAYLTVHQHQRPVPVASAAERTWWWFQDSFYWDSAAHTAGDVLALIRDRQRREETKLDRAHLLLRVEQDSQADPSPSTPQRRGRLPRELRRAVYERDGGRCVQCAATFELQYDHVLPVARGGATTVENLQLLCGACNRAKGANL